jgi:uncharacterized protein with HEPN domain
MQDAIIHRLEIIGDAMKNIPVTLRKKYSATLTAIVGMRGMICNEYFGVQMDRIWKVVLKDIPMLHRHMQKIRHEFRQEFC